MGLPVDSPDRNEDAHKYEQRGEGEGGESQAEVCTRTPPPANKKRRKGKKRYFTAVSHPFVLPPLFHIAGTLHLSTDSYDFVTCPGGS